VYAVIRCGGRQERVQEGQRVWVDRLSARVGEEVRFDPVLLVDGDRVMATPEELAQISVTGSVVAQRLGAKVRAMTYKPKTNQRRRWGHRQRYTEVEITGIG